MIRKSQPLQEQIGGGLLGKVQDVPMGILPAKKTKPLIDYLFIIQEQG